MPGTWLKQHRGHHNNHYSHGQMGHSIFFVGGPPCHKCHHSQFKCDDFFRNVSESWNISIHLSNAHCSSFHHLLMVKDLQPDHFQGIFLDSIISNQDCIFFSGNTHQNRPQEPLVASSQSGGCHTTRGECTKSLFFLARSPRASCARNWPQSQQPWFDRP